MAETDSTMVAKPLPLLTRLKYAIQLWIFKTCTTVYINAVFLLKPPPSTSQPTYTKYYPVRPAIRNRMFIPPSYKPGDKPLPLYIDIHGGGFAIGDPRFDDRYCSRMARTHGICMASIGYSLAPRARFPIAPHDIAAIIKAVLEDPDLPCDKTKVAVGGFSAGGNLAFSAVQLNGLNTKIRALVGFYPVLDFSLPSKDKITHSAPEKDGLVRIAELFNWGYIPAGTDLRNPLLSPTFANLDIFPPKICLIGCEWDMLCGESEQLATKLAIEFGGDKKALGVGNGWEHGNVRWEKVMGQVHGFDHRSGPGKEESARIQRANELHDSLAEWLHRVVFV